MHTQLYTDLMIPNSLWEFSTDTESFNCPHHPSNNLHFKKKRKKETKISHPLTFPPLLQKGTWISAADTTSIKMGKISHMFQIYSLKIILYKAVLLFSWYRS